MSLAFTLLIDVLNHLFDGTKGEGQQRAQMRGMLWVMRRGVVFMCKMRE